MPVTRADFDALHGAVLRAGAVRARARRRLARMGPAGPHVHRLRERRRGHRRSATAIRRSCSALERAGAHDLARVELVHQRAGAAPREAPGRRDVRRARVLLQLGRRGERGGAEARAPLCARPLRSRQGARDVDAQRVPRPHAVHRHRRRPGEVLERIRTVARAASRTSRTTTSQRSKRRSATRAATTSAR